MKKNLKQILHACSRGERAGQRALYEHYYSFGLNACLRYAKNREEAQEMLNDGFFKVFKNIDKYNFKFPFEPWLRRLLINAAIDYYHKHKLRYEQIDLNDQQKASLFIDPVDDLAYEDLLRAIQLLPPAYRMVFNLYEVEGYKHAEIAEQLSISVGTSKSNLARAKTKLRQILTLIEQKKSENV